jgi:peptide chain release factor 1
MGGIKEAIFSISGENVYSKMKFESGVHRVQRVPTTETSGRIHTSTITVIVMPEAEEVELQIKPSELKFDVFRSSGPGGQSVNTTDSAVRATHIPTGLSVASQQEKSQHRNKETALRILRSKLLKMKQDEDAAKQSAAKKSQIGSGDRSEKIRTYNFPQNRVTDHRFNINVFNLPEIIEGNLSLIINQAIEAEKEEKLQNLNLKK